VASSGVTMRDQSDNGAAALVMTAIKIERSSSERIAQTLSRLISEVEDGRTTARVALTTMMLKGIRAGRDLEISTQTCERSSERPPRPHLAAKPRA